jgi:carboxyl-terminal processing protease
MKKWRNLFLVLAFGAVVSLLSFKAGEKNVSVLTATGGECRAPFNLDLMWKVKNSLSSVFLEKDKLDDKKMGYGAIQGMVAALDDPYTVFLPPVENKAQNEDLQGQFGGVGIQLGYKDKNLAVMAPLAKTPAEKAGIMAGDLILKIIDKQQKIDRDTAGITLDEAVKLIRGKVGTEVTLNMYRDGEKGAYTVTLKRDNIVVPSMELEFKEKNGKKFAWIKLYKFTEQIYKDWPGIVDKIIAEKGDNFGGIVLDLRNNPGGYLQASVLVASDFIDKGVIVTQATASGKNEVYQVDQSRRKLLTEKLVVLINGGSASAAEILAGALKDYKRGKLVGEKSFGKGTVQQPEDFPDGSGLHVTVAKWLLPLGKNIHKEGIMPDIEIKYEPPKETDAEDKLDNQLDKAIETLLKI